MPKHKLLDDDDGDGDGQPKLVVNKAFAARFEVRHDHDDTRDLQGELCLDVALHLNGCPAGGLLLSPPQHNKRREELHRLQEKNPLLAARLAREVC